MQIHLLGAVTVGWRMERKLVDFRAFTALDSSLAVYHLGVGIRLIRKENGER